MIVGSSSRCMIHVIRVLFLSPRALLFAVPFTAQTDGSAALSGTTSRAGAHGTEGGSATCEPPKQEASGAFARTYLVAFGISRTSATLRSARTECRMEGTLAQRQNWCTRPRDQHHQLAKHPRMRRCT
eukprot:scaffold5187_cov103-Isochrysis_galbana.AAC.4